jgi:DNA-binding response OmpR family regulator
LGRRPRIRIPERGLHDVRAVKYQIYNLRRKLKGSGRTVAAVRGEGYRFETE